MLDKNIQFKPFQLNNEKEHQSIEFDWIQNKKKQEKQEDIFVLSHIKYSIDLTFDCTFVFSFDSRFGDFTFYSYFSFYFNFVITKFLIHFVNDYYRINLKLNGTQLNNRFHISQEQVYSESLYMSLVIHWDWVIHR